MQIELPISKSIANRLLILQAIHGDELMPVSVAMPDDVLLLHHALTIFTTHSSHCERSIGGTPSNSEASDNRITEVNLGNCGTAMRFLTAYCAQLPFQTTILDGVERMHHRPIGQLVDALREMGAQIEYLGQEGYPPLRITGCALDKHKLVRIDNPLSTQFVSALMLIGANVQTNSTSPYINITREIIDQYSHHSKIPNSKFIIEKDWSSAAFWYEHVALHGGEIELPGLFRNSLQGDKVVADIFVHLGVQTTYTPDGILISKTNDNFAERGRELLSRFLSNDRQSRTIAAQVVDVVVNKHITQDFSACPDLYPAVALTCECLGVTLHATGTDSLSIKESNRLQAVREHLTCHDHRMAMALLVAGYPVDDTSCISKSYPQFLQQYPSR